MTSLESPLVLSAAAQSDFWRKPPRLNVSTAPTRLTTIYSTKFHRARVTVSAPWRRLYDQGGLFIVLPGSIGGAGGEPDVSSRFWLKTGIEFYNEQPNLSTVAAREWADWSLLPLSDGTVTIEIEREEQNSSKGRGSSLWVYLITNEAGQEKRTAVREVTWAFETEGDIQVGVYAARPTEKEPISVGDAADELLVEFSNLTIVGDK